MQGGFHQASAVITGTANQRKNRNLYTSIGNYNNSSTKFNPNANNMIASANHSSLVALNQQLG